MKSLRAVLTKHPILMWATIFVGMTLVDFFYAEYTKSAADRQAVYASTMALLLIALQGLVTSSYVKNRWLLIPTCSGAWFGTFISLQWFM